MSAGKAYGLVYRVVMINLIIWVTMAVIDYTGYTSVKSIFEKIIAVPARVHEAALTTGCALSQEKPASCGIDGHTALISTQKQLLATTVFAPLAIVGNFVGGGCGTLAQVSHSLLPMGSPLKVWYPACPCAYGAKTCGATKCNATNAAGAMNRDMTLQLHSETITGHISGISEMIKRFVAPSDDLVKKATKVGGFGRGIITMMFEAPLLRAYRYLSELGHPEGERITEGIKVARCAAQRLGYDMDKASTTVCSGTVELSNCEKIFPIAYNSGSGPASDASFEELD